MKKLSRERTLSSHKRAGSRKGNRRHTTMSDYIVKKWQVGDVNYATKHPDIPHGMKPQHEKRTCSKR